MKRQILAAVSWTIGILALSLAAQLARTQGYIDHETMLRVVAMNGLVIAWFGNLMPKAVAPCALARQIARVSGWCFVLSGLVYAGLWAFAPIPLALTVGTGAVVAGVLVALGHCFWLVARARADQLDAGS